MASRLLKAMGGGRRAKKGAPAVRVVSAADTAQVRGYLHSGNFALNYAISGRLLRGWPLGHSCEIYGDPSTGKSFLLYRAIAEAQAMGGEAALDDTEYAFHSDWAAKHLGVNPRDLVYREPSSRTIEEHQQFVQEWFAGIKKLHDADAKKARKPKVVPYVLAADSLGLMAINALLENGKTMGMQKAQRIHDLFRVIHSELHNYPALYLAANHKISSIDMWKPDEAGGGKGAKYASTVRLDMRTPQRIKSAPGDPDEFVGVISKVFVAKNRLTIPWRTIRMSIPFKQPINPFSGLVPILERIGIIEFTKDKTIAYADEDTKLKAFPDPKHFLAQDRSGTMLMQRHPDILEVADKHLDVLDAQEDYLVAASVDEDDDDTTEDGEGDDE